jgi:HJR/Mrr/RecB family endonuclease
MAVHPEYGEQSFDHLLHRLLERKRELGRRMLVPPVNLQEDQAYFAKHFAAERKVDSTISIDEIDVMAPLEFEHWIASRMADAGYVADLTPATHDFGADGIFRHVATGACLIVQCKHRQDPEKPCDDSPVDDLLRAREAYPVGAELILAAITNAKAYSPQARNRARLYDVTLVDRTRLAQWPQGVL